MATAIPDNSATFDAFEVAAATGGRIVGEAGDSRFTGIYADSRRTQPGSIYVALRGERFDGHAFVGAAAANGARLFVVEERDAAASSANLPVGGVIVAVGDTLRAWGALAAAHLLKWRHLPGTRSVVAITGTAGKTTTKEIVAALLGAAGSTWATPGNLNNLVGVPATLFALTGAHSFAVIEMGMSLPGEIERLAAIVDPSVSVLLNVGVGHAEGVGGTRADVAREKGAILRPHRFGGPGVAVVNADDSAAAAELVRPGNQGRRVVTFGRSDTADWRLVSRAATALGSAIVVKAGSASFELTLPLPGEAAAVDLVAALAAAAWATGKGEEGAVPDGARGRLASLSLPGGRTAILRAGRLLVIDDTYNANPSSFAAALSTLAEIAAAEGRRSVVIVGEMKELGDRASAEHAALGERIRDLSPPPAAVIGCGGGLVARTLAAAEAGGLPVFAGSGTEDARTLALQHVRAGDAVLVKASRSVGAEAVVEALVERARAAAGGFGT